MKKWGLLLSGLILLMCVSNANAAVATIEGNSYDIIKVLVEYPDVIAYLGRLNAEVTATDETNFSDYNPIVVYANETGYGDGYAGLVFWFSATRPFPPFPEFSTSKNVVVTPEPVSLILFGVGGAVITVFRNRTRFCLHV